MKKIFLLLPILPFIIFTGTLSGQSTFTFHGEKVKPGSKKQFTIPINDGTHTGIIPITVFNGASDGPTIGITAGVHGYEYPPIMACQKLARQIDPAQLKGVLILVQIANVEAFAKRSPFVNPADEKNLNRSFPGDSTGSITERMAHFITTEVIAQSDYFLDIHAGDAPEDLMPYAAYYSHKKMGEISEKGKGIAAALGFEHIVVFNTTGKDYMKPSENSLYCSAEAFKRGIPSADIECGRLGQNEPACVEKIEQAVLNMLKSLELLPNQGNTAPKAPPEYITERAYYSSQTRGIFYPAKAAGDSVTKGTKLGYITDYFGAVQEEIYADEDGLILLILGTPPVNKGETIAVIAKVASPSKTR